MKCDSFSELTLSTSSMDSEQEKISETVPPLSQDDEMCLSSLGISAQSHDSYEQVSFIKILFFIFFCMNFLTTTIIVHKKILFLGYHGTDRTKAGGEGEGGEYRALQEATPCAHCRTQAYHSKVPTNKKRRG